MSDLHHSAAAGSAAPADSAAAPPGPQAVPRRLAALALGAIGVVYGDIGTSPLYTLKEVFGERGVAATPDNVLGALSLIFWALVVVVSVKYVLFIMRADNKGEGGIMALMALAQRSVRGMPRLRLVIALLAIFGAALFYGDGVITPAISVLSAVEGLEVAAPALQPWVVPITLGVILALFWLQKHGTDRIGAVFGPVCAIWFVSIAALGITGIVRHPGVLAALSPSYGFGFFLRNHAEAFFALGAVVLAVTGTEALYADMGHFGKRPIQLAWFNFVLPALVLNYFGQGALLLHEPRALANPFFHLVPRVLLYPMIALATAATVIASQAVISGAFSMTREAMQLGYVPRMRVLHTSHEMSGQIFVPWINRILLVLIVAAVLGFRSSNNLASAYGIAVTGTMVITTLLALVVARYQWRWHLAAVIGTGVGLLTVDLAFFGANIIKVASGGWFPLVLGLSVFVAMTTWRRGRELVVREIQQGGLAVAPFIHNLIEYPPTRVQGTAVFLTPNPQAVPNALLHNLKHNKVLHERNVLLTVEMLDAPVADEGERFEVQALEGGFSRLLFRFGFAENPDIPAAMAWCGSHGGPAFDMMDTTFFLSRETVVAASHRPGMAAWRDKLFAFMARNALPATAFFGIPGNRLIELGAQVEI
ncbi:potassium transporter Kup [Frateuria terrea]|uniref:Probable potassium transport system protein Kup n=1 Tax=Frateuria terrea TaxID=529704 RepID=A0A1H6Y4V2_9GAMM|nr:potassium transporter Kup [Frateuria terrea]SEJ36271.1 KUP system potassium uptake protein [Frateuria terrea]SFP48938.1 KUP system potassium uptake protein [Frateuria terrea]